MRSSYIKSPNLQVETATGQAYAHRRTGSGPGLPLVLLQHFRGSMDNWDPALIDRLAQGREVIVFDNVGVGGSPGDTPDTIEAMARDATAFITALDLDKVDLLGFSIGSFVAQEIVLARPALVRRLILAASAPQGAPGMHGWTSDVIGAIGQPSFVASDFLRIFFAGSASSQAAGCEFLQRMTSRKDGRDQTPKWETRNAQYDAIVRWGIPSIGLLERVTAIDVPTFIASGDSDPMILPRYSHLLAGLIPDASIRIYPDAAHGFLFQHHETFGDDVRAFLG